MEKKRNLTELQDNLKKLLHHINRDIDSLYNFATTDEKTGLYNHKFFANVLEMEIEKAKRGKQKLSLIVVDIDFFKKINDSIGHIKADEILGRLGKTIKTTTRKSDIPARFGGEEFFILLPETNFQKAKRFVERLRKKINSEPSLKKHGITVSGGITEFKKSDTEKSFMERADKALYKAKHSGRNRFELL
jgi:diguanylate cyclase (GGDEF)-like protein